jgi:hypothetical protein
MSMGNTLPITMWGPLSSMLTKSGVILGFDKLTICSKHNNDGEGYNWKFKILFWCMVCDWIQTSFNAPTPHL